MSVIACDTAPSIRSTLRPSCVNSVSAGRARSRRNFQPPVLGVNRKASSSFAFLPVSFLCKRSRAAAVTLNMVHHPFIQSRIHPANSTHPPFAGDPASHGLDGHLRKPTRLPRDSFMIASSMSRIPTFRSNLTCPLLLRRGPTDPTPIPLALGLDHFHSKCPQARHGRAKTLAPKCRSTPRLPRWLRTRQLR